MTIEVKISLEEHSFRNIITAMANSTNIIGRIQAKTVYGKLNYKKGDDSNTAFIRLDNVVMDIKNNTIKVSYIPLLEEEFKDPDNYIIKPRILDKYEHMPGGGYPELITFDLYEKDKI